MKRPAWLPILMFLNLSIGSAQQDPVRKEVEKLIRYETGIRHKNLPGFIVAMIEKDTTFVLPFGQRALDDPAPISRNDVFEIGGATKIFTALVFEKFSERYQMDINRSLNDFLEPDNRSFDSCKLKHLLTHTSGLPKTLPGWGQLESGTENPYAGYHETDADRFFSTYILTKNPTNRYEYSHLNYLLLQRVLTAVTELDFETLLRETIDPYGIHASGIRETTLPGYGRDLEAIPAWTPEAFKGALGIRATLDDLMRLCRLTLDGEALFASLLMRYPMTTGKDQGWVAKGWQVLPIPKKRYVYAHTGRTGGHHVFIGLLPETHTAVVVLSNSAAGTDPLGLSILNMMNQNWKRK